MKQTEEIICWLMSPTVPLPGAMGPAKLQGRKCYVPTYEGKRVTTGQVSSSTSHTQCDKCFAWGPCPASDVQLDELAGYSTVKRAAGQQSPGPSSALAEPRNPPHEASRSPCKSRDRSLPPLQPPTIHQLWRPAHPRPATVCHPQLATGYRAGRDATLPPIPRDAPVPQNARDVAAPHRAAEELRKRVAAEPPQESAPALRAEGAAERTRKQYRRAPRRIGDGMGPGENEPNEASARENRRGEALRVMLGRRGWAERRGREGHQS
mmetsp:Transcript_28290/g.70951  ORF Transcript_28290/g.70951 Transcript_28290/m.70951 type:complete len:265 (-) Transcript_28290:637-1431(-)